MANVKKMFAPNKFKVALTVVFILPVFVALGLSLFAAGALSQLASIGAVVLCALFVAAIILSYVIASLIDSLIMSPMIKVVIAVIMGFISMILAYIIVWAFLTPPMVCDPVHQPPGGDGGGIICDPVHNPCMSNCDQIMNVPDVNAQIEQKFQECMQACYN